jgi:hypothetical protein
MDCLKDYIGVGGCDAPVYSYQINTVVQPASGFYINIDLPAISLKQMDKIADEEQRTFLGLWNEIQDRAIRKFRIRVKAGYKELFGVCKIQDTWFCDNRENLALPLLYFLGSELMFERLYSDRINRYTTIDREKAKELKAEFDDQFITHLKDALELIDNGINQEGGDIFSFVETLP